MVDQVDDLGGVSAGSLEQHEDLAVSASDISESDLADFEPSEEALRLQRLAADQELLAALQAEGLQGYNWDRFAEVLAMYGYHVIRAWVRTGEIFIQCRRRGWGHLQPPQDRRPWGVDEADELALESVAIAVGKYRDTPPSRRSRRRAPPSPPSCSPTSPPLSPHTPAARHSPGIAPRTRRCIGVLVEAGDLAAVVDVEGLGHDRARDVDPGDLAAADCSHNPREPLTRIPGNRVVQQGDQHGMGCAHECPPSHLPGCGRRGRPGGARYGRFGACAGRSGAAGGIRSCGTLQVPWLCAGQGPLHRVRHPRLHQDGRRWQQRPRRVGGRLHRCQRRARLRAGHPRQTRPRRRPGRPGNLGRQDQRPWPDRGLLRRNRHPGGPQRSSAWVPARAGPPHQDRRSRRGADPGLRHQQPRPVVGEYLDAAGRFHGFRWHRGRFATIDVPGATSTTLTAINDRGQIVGVQGDAAGALHGVLLSKGVVTTFDAPGAALTLPFGINNRGQIIGFAYRDPAATAARGFLLAKGVTGPFTPVEFPGAAATVAFGINDHGRIVGGYQNPAATPSPQPTSMPPMGGTA